MKVKLIVGISIPESITRKLAVGTILSLQREPENNVDPNAVIALIDGEKAGYIANSQKTLHPNCMSATKAAKMLDREEVAGINIRLTSSHQVKTEENYSQTHWIAEAYPLPVWEDTSDSSETYEMTVGGSAVVHSNKANVMACLSNCADKLIAKLDSASGVSKVFVWDSVTISSRGSSPAGEIINPPEQVIAALQHGTRVSLTPGAVVSKDSYTVTATIKSSNTSAYIEYIDRIVKNCVMQVRDVKDRLNYMMNQMLPDKIICGVLSSIQTPDDKNCVSKPHTLYTQSNEHDYLTRSLGYYLAGRNLRLVGGKGSGKNTLVSTVCWLMNKPLSRFQGNSDMDTIELLGGQALSDGSTHFELSQLIEALQSGNDIVLDEINAIKPEVAIALHSLMDDSRSIDIPGYGHVNVNPNARIWATMNEGYIGTGELNSATADRFVPLFLTEQLDMAKLLKQVCPNAEKDTITVCTSIYDRVLKGVKDGSCTPESITTRGYIDAIEASQWLPLRTALIDNVANRPQNIDDRNTIADFIRGLCP